MFIFPLLVDLVLLKFLILLVNVMLTLQFCPSHCKPEDLTAIIVLFPYHVVTVF